MEVLNILKISNYFIRVVFVSGKRRFEYKVNNYFRYYSHSVGDICRIIYVGDKHFCQARCFYR